MVFSLTKTNQLLGTSMYGKHQLCLKVSGFLITPCLSGSKEQLMLTSERNRIMRRFNGKLWGKWVMSTPN